MAHAREFSPVLIYSLTVACFAAASWLGIFCGTLPPFDADNGGPSLLVVSTCYFAFLLAVPLFGAWHRERAGAGASLLADGRAAGGAAAEAAGADALDVQGRCEKTAERFGLSPRETEILGYPGRGHGIVFVANTLVISESTVRTHVKNIYKKLGVNSREELLQLVDEA